jgi:hypothetical protein
MPFVLVDSVKRDPLETSRVSNIFGGPRLPDSTKVPGPIPAAKPSKLR